MMLLKHAALLVALCGGSALASPVHDVDSAAHGSKAFTPRDMLALPRPGGMIPSPDRRWGLEVVSEHDFKDRK